MTDLGLHTCGHPIERGKADPTDDDPAFPIWHVRNRTNPCWKCAAKEHNQRARAARKATA